MFRNLRSLLGAGLLALGCGVSAVSAASACDCPPRCRYVCKVCHEVRRVACTCVVTCYDQCGCPYRATRTYYRYVTVPVKKLVRVCDYD
jgi:hypothetical protein